MQHHYGVMVFLTTPLMDRMACRGLRGIKKQEAACVNIKYAV